MPTTEVTEIIARAKAAADMEDSGFVTAAQWLRWANLEHRMFTAWLLRHGYVNVVSSATHVADGTGAFGDVTDPTVILGVWESVGETFRPLRSTDTATAFASGTTTGTAVTFTVADRGDGDVTITLQPRPMSGTYVALYVAAPDELVTGTPAAGQSDEVRYPLGLEERIVLGMARRALAKEGSSTAEIGRQIREVEAHAEAVAWDRAAGGVQSVRNVDRRERGWGDMTVPGREAWYWT